MKTAISIPDQTFQHAEVLATRLGVSRSALYTKAVEELLERTRSDEITKRLNEVYAEHDLTDEEKAFSRAAARAGFERIEW
jgi:hypothetical protein